SILAVSDSVSQLKETKRDLFWLLKQVIQVEARRKREAKKTITEVYNCARESRGRAEKAEKTPG
ncbi:hypothetical protein TrRE_jg3642, partial [Triparma retinervis]